MLQQILRDMWVDPEILQELDETQKQTLFCKMREEQVRRWRVWDQKLSRQEDAGLRKSSPRENDEQPKSVTFRNGSDGEPWVWVMGEHENDRSIEDILLDEAKEKARQLALQEAEQLRKSVEKELTQLIDYQTIDCTVDDGYVSSKENGTTENDPLEIYASVDELRSRIKTMEPQLDIPLNNISDANKNSQKKEDKDLFTDKSNQNEVKYTKNKLNFSFVEGKYSVLQELEPVSVGGGAVGVRVAAWERRVAATRAGDILRALRQRRAAAARDAEREQEKHQVAWEERERKAKEADIQIREIARRAREEHRRSSFIVDSVVGASDVSSANAINPPTASGKPTSKEAIVEWFRKVELPKGSGLTANGNPASWFHGLITRTEAENLMEGCEMGSFLIRISERIWGYAITYKAPDRCKHYLIDASQGTHYQFLGANQISHKSLDDLVRYHREVVITENGQETLTRPCIVKNTPAVFPSSGFS